MEETIQKAQTYKELDTQLVDWLAVTNERVDEVTSLPVDLNSADSIKHVNDELNHLAADIETNRPTINRLKGSLTQHKLYISSWIINSSCFIMSLSFTAITDYLEVVSTCLVHYPLSNGIMIIVKYYLIAG